MELHDRCDRSGVTILNQILPFAPPNFIPRGDRHGQRAGKTATHTSLVIARDYSDTYRHGGSFPQGPCPRSAIAHWVLSDQAVVAVHPTFYPAGPVPLSRMNRRFFCRSATAAFATVATAGCGDPSNSIGRLDNVWSRRGLVDGRLWRPRAMDTDAQGNVYIVDFTARIQVFDSEGNFSHGWRTPDFKNGKPTGVTIQDDRLLVADTHYFRVLAYTLDGQLMQDETIGGVEGRGPGEFGFVTDAVRDSTGALYVAEYGDYDRIQKFSPDGRFVLQWGSHGAAPGQFVRPQNLLIDPQDRLWVCDACNHRIQVFDTQGELLLLWGEEGTATGRLSYPYDIAMDDQGHVLLLEHGNHRVQKFNQNGQPLGVWGAPGRGPGQLDRPWALARGPTGRVHVLDTYNHRVQTIVM